MTQTSQSQSVPVGNRPPVWAYVWWAVVGALAGVGAVSVLTVGVFLLPVALVLAGVGAFWQPLRTTSVVAAIGGLAVAPLYLAWLNRDGPGQVCTTAGDVTECSERWSPWPFLVVGVVLLGIAVVAVARTRGAQSQRS